MSLRKINLRLNCRKTDNQATIEGLHVGDVNSTQLVMTLSDGSKVIDLTGYSNITAIIHGRKPDDTEIYNDCQVDGNKIIYTLTAQDTAVMGTVVYQLDVQVTGSDGYERSFSPTFRTRVSPKIYEPSYSLLEEEPDDWEENYNTYYRKSGDNYVQIGDDSCPEYEPNTFYVCEDPAIESVSEYLAFWLAYHNVTELFNQRLVIDTTTENVGFDADNIHKVFIKAKVDGELGIVFTALDNTQFFVGRNGNIKVRNYTNQYQSWTLLAEKPSNKASAINNSNNYSTVLYPSIKAVADYVDSEISVKANSSDVTAALSDKADKSTTYTKAETDSLLNAKANASDVTTALAGKSDTNHTHDMSAYATNSSVNSALAGKADVNHTHDLSAYATNSSVNTALEGKADKSTTYTKSETDTLLSEKANASAVATSLAGKADINHTHDMTAYATNADVQTALAGKADVATTLSGYGITDGMRVVVVSGTEGTEVDSCLDVKTIYRVYVASGIVNNGIMTVINTETATHHLTQYAFSNSGFLISRSKAANSETFSSWQLCPPLQTAISSNSTDYQYPSAKAVYTALSGKADADHTHSQYLTEHQSLSGYYTKTEIDNKGYLTSHQDISGKADKATTLSGYGITNAYTKTEADNKYLTTHQDISGKEDTANRFSDDLSSFQAQTADYTKYPTVAGLKKAAVKLRSEINQDIPSNISELTNDAGYLTSHQDVSGKENTSNKQTSISSTSNPSTDNSYYPSVGAVRNFVNAQIEAEDEYNAEHYLTSHQDISGKENTSNKVTSLSNNSTDTQYPSALAVYNLVRGYKIPSYWESALSTAIGKVKAIQREHGADCINLVWFSDIHLMKSATNFGKNVPALSAFLSDMLDIPFVIFTGDAATNSIEPTEAAMRNDFEYFNELTEPIRDKLINCYGNHDGAWGDNSQGSTGYQAAYAWHIRPRDYWNDLIRKQTIGDGRHYSDDGSYGYIDFPGQKLRIVQLNSFWVGDNDTYNQDGTMIFDYMHHGGYGQDQLDWLAEEALHFDEDGWSVLFMAHMPPAQVDDDNYLSTSQNRDATILNGILSAYATGGSYTGSYSYNSGRNEGTWANVSVNVDFSNLSHKAYPIAFLCGHCHRSRIDTTTLPFPIVTITCATNSSYDPSSEGARTADSATETAFDVLSICKDSKMLYLTRLGVGADRNTSYRTIIPIINQVPVSTDDNGNIYNSTGYKDGYRFNSSNEEAIATGYFTTGWIPVTEGSVVSFSGFVFPETSVSGGANANYCRLIVGKTNKTVEGSATSSVIAGYTGSVVESNSLKTFIINSAAHSIYNNAAFIRLSGYGSGANAVVTVE